MVGTIGSGGLPASRLKIHHCNGPECLFSLANSRENFRKIETSGKSQRKTNNCAHEGSVQPDLRSRFQNHFLIGQNMEKKAGNGELEGRVSTGTNFLLSNPFREGWKAMRSLWETVAGVNRFPCNGACKTPPRCRRSWPKSAFLRYLGIHTRWYLQSHILSFGPHCAGVTWSRLLGCISRGSREHYQNRR